MNRYAARRRKARAGFTLIELLVVIAIIAILAAILFPVFATVRENMRQTTCNQNMADIIRGMKMYNDDWGVYPDALYGVSYNGGPLDTRLGAIKYVKSTQHFTCPNHPGAFKNNTLSPCGDPSMGGSPAVHYRTGAPLAFPEFDSYDCQRLPITGPNTRVLNYKLRWSPAASGALNENPRQLYRKNPPADTVVTWCMYHSGMNAAGQPASGSKALVAFLDGRVAKIDARKMLWTATPPPWQVQR